MRQLKTLRVLIAEDQALVRQGMAALISDIVGEIIEVENGEQALQKLKEKPIDIALIDIGLPLRTGLDVLREARQRELSTKIIILTGDTETYSPSAIYKAGADGFLYKTADADHFLDTFTAIAKGTSVSKLDNTEGENAPSIAQLRETLTARELQIVKLVVEGRSNKDVAGILFISVHTVRKHREHINRKLDIHSPIALALFAIKAELV